MALNYGELTVLVASIFMFLTNCNNPETSTKIEITKPPIEKFSKKELKVSKSKKIGKENSINGEFTILPLSKLTVSKKVNIEIEETSYNTYYRSKSAERNEKFISLRIKLSASQKWNNSKGDFLPDFRIYKLTSDKDSVTTDDFIFLKKMDINFYYKPKDSYYVLEQYFDYNETGNFILHCPLSESDLKRRIYLTVTTDKSESFNKENIIAILN